MSETMLSGSATTDLALLERRVQRLEDCLAQEARGLEDRVVDQVCLRMQGVIEKAMPVPAAAPLAPAAAPEPPPAPTRTAAPWLILDVWRECKMLIAMLLDMRFKLAWSTRMVTLVLVPYIVCSHLVFPVIWPLAWIPVVGSVTTPFFQNAFNLALAFVLFKCLNRDLRRYQEWKSW